MAYSFGIDDVLAALGVTAADWELQDFSDSEQRDTATVKDRLGSYVADADVAHNERTERTCTLKCLLSAGATAAFTLGGEGTTGVVITQFSLKESFNDHATLSVTAHAHVNGEDGAAHLAAPVSQAVSLSAGFGVQATRLGGELLDCKSSELSGSVEHTDELSHRGRFLVGASHGLRFECTEEYLENAGSPTVPAPWKLDSEDVKQGEQFKTRQVKAHAYSLS